MIDVMEAMEVETAMASSCTEATPGSSGTGRYLFS
jgi:hypothetical protein